MDKTKKLPCALEKVIFNLTTDYLKFVLSAVWMEMDLCLFLAIKTKTQDTF